MGQTFLSLLPFESLLLLSIVGVFTGFIKAGIPSLGTLLTASVALMFPPRDALGITLLYLLVGDVVAVSMYWRLAHWRELKRMSAPVLLGILLGGGLLAFLDNQDLGLALGLLVILLVSFEPIRPRITGWALLHPNSVRSGSGMLAGIATTLGNAAGPILSLYFLLLKLDKKAFVGTGAIFFCCVNLAKIPIFMGQGIFKANYFASVAATAPFVIIGAILGKKFLDWVPQLWFNRIVLFFTGIAGVGLVVRYLFE